MMLKLFYAPHTCSLASHIALEEAEAAYTTVRVDFSVNEQCSPEYLEINPKGRVPALVTDRGILTESPAMLAFIAQSFPQARLAPFDDPFAFAQVQAFNLYLCATLHVAHAHRMRGHRWADDPAAIAEMQRKVPETVGASYDLIEREMLKGPWVMGDSYTICDPYLFTFAQWLEDDYFPNKVRIAPLEHFPVVRDMVIDQNDFLAKLESIKPYIIPKEGKPVSDGAYRQTPKQMEQYYQYSQCINCLLCYAACPQYGMTPQFTGPAALALLHRYNADSRDQGWSARSELTNSEDGVWHCTLVGYCSEVCPKDVDPAHAINQNKVNSVMDYFGIMKLMTPRSGAK